jgi:hypothetical protein
LGSGGQNDLNERLEKQRYSYQIMRFFTDKR